MAVMDWLDHWSLEAGCMPSEMMMLRAPRMQERRHGLGRHEHTRGGEASGTHMKRISSWNNQLSQINHNATETAYPRASSTPATILRVAELCAVSCVVGNEAGNTKKLFVSACRRIVTTPIRATYPSRISDADSMADNRQYQPTRSLAVYISTIVMLPCHLDPTAMTDDLQEAQNAQLVAR